MKKNILLVLIGLIAGTTITATAAYVYTARDIGYSPSDENWNVTNASDALSSLKEDLNEVNTNVTEYKQQITEALSDKGLNVDENSTMQEITSGIQSMSNGPMYLLKTFDNVNTTGAFQPNTVTSFTLSTNYYNNSTPVLAYYAPVDVTNFSKLYVDWRCFPWYGGDSNPQHAQKNYVGLLKADQTIAQDATFSDDKYLYDLAHPRRTDYIDVSDLSGEYYVKLVVVGKTLGDAKGGMELFNIWFE